VVLSVVLLAIGVVGVVVSVVAQLRARRRTPPSGLEREARPVRHVVARAVARGELPDDPALHDLAVAHARSQAPLEWLLVQQSCVGLVLASLLPLQEPGGAVDVLLAVGVVLTVLGVALVVRSLLGARRVIATADREAGRR